MTDCAGYSEPADVPSGWVKYPVFECKFDIYVPTSPDELPGPLAWEPCMTQLGPEPYSCQQLVVDGETTEKAISGDPIGHVEKDGTVVLQFRKYYGKVESDNSPSRAYLAVVAEADGSVRQAFWISRQYGVEQPFWFSGRGIHSGKASWQAREYMAGVGFLRSAAIASGDSNLKPPVLGKWSEGDPDEASVRPGASYYALYGVGLSVKSWDGATDAGKIYQGLDPEQALWVDDALVWGATSIPLSELMSWTLEDGTRTLLSFGNDLTQSVASLGTDGKDMVWLHGSERDPTGDGSFAKVDIMTAPFTTDPSALEPRRLRSYPAPFIWGAATTGSVGCGHAVLSAVPEAGDQRIIIVRLLDGVSWTLTTPSDKSWYWGRPIAITCDEVFVAHGYDAQSQIRRIPLSSLGVGTPAD